MSRKTLGPYSENMIIIGDCLDVMGQMPDGCIDLVVTSPPYWNHREYAHWDTYEEYLSSVNQWFQKMGRVVKPGRHVCWNIQPYLPTKRNGKERWHLPLSTDTITTAYRHGFMLEQTVIWHKTNARCQRMFGSYPYPPTIIYTPSIEDIHIFRKGGQASLASKAESSKITKEEWTEWTIPIWHMAIDYRAIGHPAYFTSELPRRCIKLHSFVGDIVFDPFMGSGTTAVAANRLDRNFFGCDINPEYVAMSLKRIAQDRERRSQLKLF